MLPPYCATKVTRFTDGPGYAQTNFPLMSCEPFGEPWLRPENLRQASKLAPFQESFPFHSSRSFHSKRNNRSKSSPRGNFYELCFLKQKPHFSACALPAAACCRWAIQPRANYRTGDGFFRWGHSGNIIVENLGTHVARTLTSNGEGNYFVPDVDLGFYSLRGGSGQLQTRGARPHSGGSRQRYKDRFSVAARFGQ